MCNIISEYGQINNSTRAYSDHGDRIKNCVFALSSEHFLTACESVMQC